MRKIAVLSIAVLFCVSAKAESLDKLTRRVFKTAEEQAVMLAGSLGPNELPRNYSSDGKFVKSDCYWWCSGFFPGTLWYIYSYNGDGRYAQMALEQTLKCEPVQYVKDSHDVGFMINCSYGNAMRIGGLDSLGTVLQTAAHSLATRYNPTIGCTQSWGASDDWKFPVIIDNMMNLELFVRVAEMFDEPELLELAKKHADTTIKNHFRDDYTTWHVVDYDPATGEVRHKQTVQGYSDSSTWARGEAWALYGYTMMAELTGDNRYLNQAEEIARWTIANLPKDGVQYWDYTAAEKLLANEPGLDRKHAGEVDGNILRDASAAAITASAFIKLSSLTKDKRLEKACIATAKKQLRTLASPEYLAEAGSNGGFLLKHCTGHYHSNSEVDVALTYADYYFLEALLRLSGRL